MKTLQNNFTSPEQSKRLLELGLPADSADCYYSQTCRAIVTTDDEMDKKEFYRAITPVWSVGRLIEIMMLCCLMPQESLGKIICSDTYESYNSILDVLLDDLEYNIMYYDFSKLED